MVRQRAVRAPDGRLASAGDGRVCIWTRLLARAEPVKLKSTMVRSWRYASSLTGWPAPVQAPCIWSTAAGTEEQEPVS